MALSWIKAAGKETGLPTAVEVANAKHTEDALKAGIDILWVGARSSANPFAVQEIADALRGTDTPVLVKNPINPDIELWIGALERINKAGITKLGRDPPRILHLRTVELPEQAELGDPHRAQAAHSRSSRSSAIRAISADGRRRSWRSRRPPWT